MHTRSSAPVSIAVQNVHFNYPARPALRVLSGLSLTVHPGEIVALVGPSGGGKSSIVKLVERFYMPSEGGARCAVLCRATLCHGLPQSYCNCSELATCDRCPFGWGGLQA